MLELEPLAVQQGAVTLVEVFDIALVIELPEAGMKHRQALRLKLDVRLGMAADDGFRLETGEVDFLAGDTVTEDLHPRPGRRGRGLPVE